jgi:hypothetical protein
VQYVWTKMYMNRPNMVIYYFWINICKDNYNIVRTCSLAQGPARSYLLPDGRKEWDHRAPYCPRTEANRTEVNKLKFPCFIYRDVFSMVCYNSELFSEIMNQFRHVVGILGWGISPSQGHCVRRTAQHRNTRKTSSGIWTNYHRGQNTCLSSLYDC